MDLKTIIVGGKDLTEKQEKIRKLFMYLVSGGITTVVNWVLYIVIDKLIQVDMTVDIIGKPVSLKFIINQIICWIVSVLVAYFLNRITVFRSKGSIGRELMSFFGARIISFLALELGLYSLMIWGCIAMTGLPIDTAMTTISIFGLSFGFTYEYLVKLINSVFIVIANYVMSKLMVFKKKDMVDYNAGDKASDGKEKADV
jgi:putative flippase GtrA